MIYLQGIYEGYQRKSNELNSDKILTFDEFYLLTNMGDLEDIIPSFNTQVNYQTQGRCSLYLGFYDKQQSVGFSHGTHNKYSYSLRIFKTINWQFQNPLLKNKEMSFSSRPGDMESKDDFYVLFDQKMIVSETSLLTFNTSYYSRIAYNALPAWLRGLVANRISQSNIEWFNNFKQYNSATHNNQWIVVDFKSSTSKDFVSLTEQYYDYIGYYDFSQLFLQQGYIASYNTIYNFTIYQESGYPYNYVNSSRALLFKYYAKQTTTFDQIKEITRINRKENGDYCNDVIAPRCDLLKTNPYTFGNIDGKAVNQDVFVNRKIFINSAPTNSELASFEWKNFENISHEGISEKMNFSWCQYNIDTNSCDL